MKPIDIFNDVLAMNSELLTSNLNRYIETHIISICHFIVINDIDNNVS